ncbi:MAG: hypothetical protein QRY74_03215 [Chlamydia sp.]
MEQIKIIFYIYTRHKKRGIKEYMAINPRVGIQPSNNYLLTSSESKPLEEETDINQSINSVASRILADIAIKELNEAIAAAINSSSGGY